MSDERDCAPDRHWLLNQGFIPSRLYRDMGGMSQDHWEYSISHLILSTFMRPPLNILEIGVYGGWTMMGWLQLAMKNAHCVCLDILKRPTAPLPENVTFIEADSHDHETWLKVKEHFPHGVDFLFIDGDHSLRGCVEDWNMYAPLVNPGGVVGFHDILIGDVRATWRECMKRFPTVQIQNTAPDGSRMGIGLVFRLPHVEPFKTLVVEDV